MRGHHFPSQQGTVGRSSTFSREEGRNTLLKQLLRVSKPQIRLFRPNFPQPLRLLGVGSRAQDTWRAQPFPSVQCCPQKTSNWVNQEKHRAGRLVRCRENGKSFRRSSFLVQHLMEKSPGPENTNSAHPTPSNGAWMHFPHQYLSGAGDAATSEKP